jgi:hypothetical protein
MDVKELSVSKLCCPVCWDLLEILRDGKVDTLQVRGRHAILYDMELPPWLSIDVLEKMVGRYFAYAKTELKNIQPIDKEGNRAHRHVSVTTRTDSHIMQRGYVGLLRYTFTLPICFTSPLIPHCCTIPMLTLCPYPVCTYPLPSYLNGYTLDPTITVYKLYL